MNVSEIETAKVVQVDKGSLAEMVRGVRGSSSVLAAEPVAQMEAAKQEVASASSGS